MSAADNALIDVGYYRDHAGIDVDSTAFPDAQIEQFINQASMMIESQCNRKFITPAADITEIFDGNGTRTYLVKQARISTTPTSLKYWSSTAFTATTYTWTYDGDTGKVYFTDGNVFSKGAYNWEVVYKYGWTQANLPEDLKLACAMLVNHLRLVNKKAGVSSESFGDSSTSYDLRELPLVVQQVIDRYKVLSYG